MTRKLSEQEIVRRESLQKLRDLGIEPYPAARFDVDSTSKQIKKNYKEGKKQNVVIAGRLMSRRIMGKASFAELTTRSRERRQYSGIAPIGSRTPCPSTTKTGNTKSLGVTRVSRTIRRIDSERRLRRGLCCKLTNIGSLFLNLYSISHFQIIIFNVFTKDTF